MRRILSVVVTLAAMAAATPAPMDAQSGRLINITGNDSLQYSLTTIVAKPGERLTVALRTVSMQPAAQMAHNFVILKPGAKLDQFVMMAGMARDHGYLPPQLKDQVLVASEMVAANAVTRVTFTAPTKPGTYTYFCTFPAHFNGGMKGVLVIK